jgi:hypothetical protein
VKSLSVVGKIRSLTVTFIIMFFGLIIFKYYTMGI